MANNQYAQPPARRAPNQTPPEAVPDFMSLFVPAAEVKTLMRIVLYGSWGVGKTPTALTFPRPAVIDVEGLAQVYARSFPNARFMPANNMAAVKMAIRSVIADGGKNCDTLVIDSLTPIYDERKMFYLEKFGYLDQVQWSRINTEMKSIYNLLALCPVHTVVIGREAVLYEETAPYKAGDKPQLKAVGLRMDLDKAAGYQPNICIHLTGNKAGVVDKVQGVEMSKGTVIPDCTWDGFFRDVAKSLATGDDPQDITKGVGKALFTAYWNGRGVKNSQIIEALRVKKADDWKHGRSAADERVYEYAVNKKWIATEDNTPSATQPPAPLVTPLGTPVRQPAAPRVPQNGFEEALNDALVPMNYRDFGRMISTYDGLVNDNQIPPDWDITQIIEHMVNYALANSE